MNQDLIQTGAFLGCVLLSFFLSGFESGVFALSRLRIRQWAREGHRSARLLLKYLDEPEQFLWTIVVGNTLANLGVTTMIYIWLHAALGTRPALFWSAFSLAAFVIVYLFCELLPKTLFQRFPNRTCMRMVAPFRLIHILLSPLVGLVEWIARTLLKVSGGSGFGGRWFGSRDELRRMMQETGTSLSAMEHGLINRVLDLQNIAVGQIARPLASAITVEAATPVRDILRLCREHQLTRLPVWTGTGPMRRIVGVVSLRTLLYEEGVSPDAPARQYLRPALYFDDSMRLEAALRRMQRSGQHFAVVLGPNRKETSLVTLWDILRAVFDAPAGKAES